MAKLSVIVPVYGVEPWLRNALDSVLRQTLRDIEVICVDDGSPDRCGEILNEYAERDQRIRVHHQKNSGTGAARNRALDMACGEYIAFFDPDDYYLSDDVLQVLYETAVSNNAVIAGGRIKQFLDKGDYGVQEFESGDPFPYYGIVDYRDYQSMFWFQCYIYKREFLNVYGIRFPQLTYCEDSVFFVKAMVAAHKFIAINKFVYAHRIAINREIDWAANGATKQKEHLNGAILTMVLAEKYHLEIVFAKLAKQTFKHVPDLKQLPYVESQLRDIYLLVRSSKLVTRWQKLQIVKYIIYRAKMIDRLKICLRFMCLSKKEQFSSDTVALISQLQQ